MAEHRIPQYKTYADSHSSQKSIEMKGHLEIARNLVDIALSPKKNEIILKEFGNKFSSREVSNLADSIISYLGKKSSFYKAVDEIAKERGISISKQGIGTNTISYPDLIRTAVYKSFLDDQELILSDNN